MKCGLLGEKLSHSFSVSIHRELGTYEYRLIEKSVAEVDEFLTRGDYDVLNVTIPYKRRAWELCGELSDVARKLGNVNVVVKTLDGKLFGDNTDYYGFVKLLDDLAFDARGKKCVILGSGGAAHTAKVVFEERGAKDVVIISRRGEDNYDNIGRHADASILVNATPVGMYPNVDSSPVVLDTFKSLEAIVDLIYNPEETLLLKSARERGIRCINGLGMLLEQARRASFYMNQNLYLYGPPGSGKSTFAKILAKSKNMSFVDLDAKIEEVENMSISEIFAKKGEVYFREVEKRELKKLSEMKNTVVALGGGALLDEESKNIALATGRVIVMDCPKAEIKRRVMKSTNRPLLKSDTEKKLLELLESRASHYKSFSEHISRPEILAPAGDFISLEAALSAGADAIYFGLGAFNMRARASANFRREDLPEIAKRCYQKAKVFMTLNSIIYEDELKDVEELIVYAKDYVDAFIVADWAVIKICQKCGAPFHISTQMSASNSEAVKFLQREGAERVVLARECSLREIRKIANACDVELEAFVHGAQCVAVSGRCFMSQDVFGASANRGECHQPCRRRFVVKAVDLYEDASGKPVHESDTAFEVEPHTILSAKDLCSVEFVDKLIEAGITSFKIEGRARNADYVKTVVGAYRHAVDAVACGAFTPDLAKELVTEVKKVFHRELSCGLYYGRPGENQFTVTENSLATTIKCHVGIVIDYFAKVSIAQIKIQDHSIAEGDTLQIHGNTTGVQEFKAEGLRRDDERLHVANKGEWVTLKTPRCRIGDKVFYIKYRA